MAYIGNPPTIGQWRKLDDISGSFNGSTTTFTTAVGGSNVTAGSANQLIVSLGGVIQQPNVDYSVTTNSIIFTTAPASGLDFFAVLAGDALNAAVPADGTITTAKLAGNLTVDLDSGSAAAPSLTFDSNTGLYSPAGDEVSVATGGTERLRIDSTGQIGAVSLGTASAPVFSFTGDTNTGIYSPGADQVAISTNGTGRLSIDANGNVAVDTNTLYVDAVNNRVAVGTTSPSTRLHVYQTGSTQAGLVETDQSASVINFKSTGQASGQPQFGCGGSDMILLTNGAERARIDSSGRLLVGTSTARANFYNSTLTSLFQVESATGTRLTSFTYGDSGNSGPIYVLAKHRSASVGGTTVVAADDQLGTLSFQGSDGTEFVAGAEIAAQVDGTPGANDMPGRLVFSTTADGASSPTERMRITSGGEIVFGTTSTTNGCRLALANTNATRKWGFGTIGTNTQFYIVDDTTGSGVQLNAGSTSWSTFSDERLKENLIPIQDGLHKVSQLRAVTGRYKTDEQGVSRSFLIAQDVQAVLPEAVDVMSDDIGTLSLKYTEVIPLLVSALKESKERIESLEARLTAAGI